MKHVPLIVLLGAVVIAVPLMLARAGIDANDDGCVDLADYAIMQQEFTGPDCVRKEILSFYGAGDSGTIVIIPQVPGENGFVVTDILCRADSISAAIVQLVEEFGDETEIKLRFVGPDYQNPTELHFNSGIPFRSGSRVMISGPSLRDVTISGYTY